MINLIKCELIRFFKSKYFLVLAILAGSFALAVPLLELALKTAVTKVVELYGTPATIEFSAFSRMLGAMSPSALFGLLLPVLASVILAQDFRNGTVRTKIICGTPKSKIYLADYIAALIFITALMFGYGILSLLFSLMFFPPFPETVIVGTYVGNIFLNLLFAVISYIFVASVILLVVMVFRTQGLSILMYIVFTFALQFVGSMISTIIETIKIYETNMDDVITFLSVFNWINPFYLMQTIGYSAFDTPLIISNIVTPLVFAVGNYFLGYLAFVKKDIK